MHIAVSRGTLHPVHVSPHLRSSSCQHLQPVAVATNTPQQLVNVLSAASIPVETTELSDGTAFSSEKPKALMSYTSSVLIIVIMVIVAASNCLLQITMEELNVIDKLPHY